MNSPQNLRHLQCSHSQFAEDLLLQEIFAETPPGVCIEVGAFDGVNGSATLVFEQRGWTTILVEPVPTLAEQIRKRRRGLLFEVAAGPENSTAVLKVAEGDLAISTVSDSIEQQRLYALRQERFAEIRVRQMTLDSILSESKVTQIDFATIDVEGFELEVLQGWDLVRWQPRVIIVEDNSRGLDARVSGHLYARGYVCFHHTGVNDWYAKLNDAALVTASARIKQWARKRSRVIRTLVKSLVPSPMIKMARQAGIAGE